MASTTVTDPAAAASVVVPHHAPSRRGRQALLRWPGVLLALCGGLALATAADGVGRAYGSSANLLFWLGIALLVIPSAARLIAGGTPRAERIALVVLFALALYLVKVLRTPVTFAFHDEFAHWRTLDDIISTHHLFVHNPLIPESGSYPGLEVLTSAVTELSGLGVFPSALLVLATGRIVLVLALFLLLERASGSARTAGIGSLVYAGNPNFLFFDSQFAYESLALPLAALLAYLAVRPAPGGRGAYARAVLALCLCGGALAVTHHLTSWIFALALVGLLVVSTAAARRGAPHTRRMIVPATLVAIAAPLLWFADVGTGAIEYVTPHLAGGGKELLQIALGQSAPRKLFVSAQVVSPPWERALGFAAVGLVLAGLLWIAVLVKSRRLRLSSVGWFLTVACLLYPVTLALRLTAAGEESANRTSEFVYIAIGFALGALATSVLRASGRGRRRLAHAAFAVAATIIIGGGIVIGWARWARLPGPFIVAGDPNSIQSEGIDAARWARAHLGPGNRIATDRIDGLEMGSPWGEQHPLSSLSDGVSAVPLMIDRAFDGAARDAANRGRVAYVVVDRRLSTGLPYVGAYVEDGEPSYRRPLSRLAASKFDALLGTDRIFDSGAIQVFALPRSGR